MRQGKEKQTYKQVDGHTERDKVRIIYVFYILSQKFFHPFLSAEAEVVTAFEFEGKLSRLDKLIRT